MKNPLSEWSTTLGLMSIRQVIYKSLLRSYKTPIVTAPGQVSPNSSVVSSTSESKKKKVPRRTSKKRQMGDISIGARKEAAEELLQCSSKD